MVPWIGTFIEVNPLFITTKSFYCQNILSSFQTELHFIQQQLPLYGPFSCDVLEVEREQLQMQGLKC